MPDPTANSGELDNSAEAIAARAAAASKDNGLVEFDVGGKKLMVPNALAAAISAERAQREGESRHLMTQFNTQLEEIKKSVVRKPADPGDKGEKKADFWDNPEAFFESMRNDFVKLVDEKVGGVKSDLTNAYTREKSDKDWWGSFYEKNDDLKSDDFFVKAVLQRDWNEIKDMPAATAVKELGDRARNEMLRMGVTKKPTKSTSVEGQDLPGSSRKSGEQEEQPEKVISLSEQIKARREAKRKSAYKKSA